MNKPEPTGIIGFQSISRNPSNIDSNTSLRKILDMFVSNAKASPTALGNAFGSPDTVKDWFKAGSSTIPSPSSQIWMEDLIRQVCTTPDIANNWIKAFNDVWLRLKEERTHAVTLTKLKKLICKASLASPLLNQLSSPFSAGVTLPLASTYVDLALTHYLYSDTNPYILQPTLTLAEKISRENEFHYAIRLSAQDVLDTALKQNTLIIGSPGAGKSSLLRQITLGIADKKWKNFDAPLFVEARGYWLYKKSNPQATLISYAINNLHIPGMPHEVFSTMMEQKNNRKILLLVDGLDEIAFDEAAVQTVYSELREISKSFSWVITSRQTGLVGTHLGETQRYEMMEFDDESIERLIDNWGRALTDKSTINLDTKTLKREIFSANTSIYTMARNPFLLTALCYLKALAPEESLPTNSAATYEALIEGMYQQARRSHGDFTVESPSAIESFAYYLYTKDHYDVRQIFNDKDWRDFLKKNTHFQQIDFEKNILPSRFISSIGEALPHYHYLHLSIHEYLVAVGLLSEDINKALSIRFIPSWQNIFQFYGALLYQTKRYDDFRVVVSTIYDETDNNEFTYLTLAQIFSSVGITNTSEWLSEIDLRDMLYASSLNSESLGNSLKRNALSILDSHWLENKVSNNLRSNLDLLSSTKNYNELYDGYNLILNSRKPDCLFTAYGQLKTTSSKNLIKEAFWGTNQNHALLAAHSYALVATPSERQDVLREASKTELFDNKSIKLFAFALESRRPEFVSFLAKILNLFKEDASGPYDQILRLLSDIGNDDTAEVFDRLLRFEIKRLREPYNAFERTLNAIASMGGHRAHQLLTRVITHPACSEWHNDIMGLIIATGDIDEEFISDALLNKELSSSALAEGLAIAVKNGNYPSDECVKLLNNQIDCTSLHNIFDYSDIESYRLDIGREPILSSKLCVIAESILARLLSKDDENDFNSLISWLMHIMDTLSKAKLPQSSLFAEKIIFEGIEEEYLLVPSLFLLGRLYSSTNSKQQGAPTPKLIINKRKILIKQCRNLLFKIDQNNELINAATYTIGQLDINELNRIKSAYGAHFAFEELAGTESIYVFDDFWCDQAGRQRKWVNPPNKLCFIYDIEDTDILGIVPLLGHELSRYSFYWDVTPSKDCTAILIFGAPQDDFSQEMINETTKLHSRTKTINIDINQSEENIANLAAEIAATLLR